MRGKCQTLNHPSLTRLMLAGRNRDRHDFSRTPAHATARPHHRQNSSSKTLVEIADAGWSRIQVLSTPTLMSQMRGRGFFSMEVAFLVDGCHMPSRLHVASSWCTRHLDGSVSYLGYVPPSKTNDLCGGRVATARHLSIETAGGVAALRVPLVGVDRVGHALLATGRARHSVRREARGAVDGSATGLGSCSVDAVRASVGPHSTVASRRVPEASLTSTTARREVIRNATGSDVDSASISRVEVASSGRVFWEREVRLTLADQLFLRLVVGAVPLLNP